MKLTLDTTARTLQVEDGEVLPLYSPEAFSTLSQVWLQTGWGLRYSYGFTWFGRPLIQLPEDVLRIQELIFSTRPDVIVETGIAHGGSMVLYASLFEALGHGRVIGVDIDIRPHNRAAIEAHALAPRISLLQGSSIAPDVVADVRSRIAPGERVLVILDSNHSRAHVRAELEAYAPLVAPGGWIVATDGIMRDLADVPGGDPSWTTDNPCAAVDDFLAAHPEFEAAEPARGFSEGQVQQRITYWPKAYLRRR